MTHINKQIKCFVLTVNDAPIFVFFGEEDAEKHYEEFIEPRKDNVEYGLKEVAAQSLDQFLRVLASGKLQYFEPLELSH